MDASIGQACENQVCAQSITYKRMAMWVAIIKIHININRDYDLLCICVYCRLKLSKKK